jgi:hypothetical protein
MNCSYFLLNIDSMYTHTTPGSRKRPTTHPSVRSADAGIDSTCPKTLSRHRAVRVESVKHEFFPERPEKILSRPIKTARTARPTNSAGGKKQADVSIDRPEAPRFDPASDIKKAIRLSIGYRGRP